MSITSSSVLLLLIIQLFFFVLLFLESNLIEILLDFEYFLDLLQQQLLL